MIKDEILKLHFDGLKVNQIVETLNCNKKYVYNVFKSNGIETDNERKRREVIELFKTTDATIYQISLLLNVSESMVKTINRQSGYKYRPMGRKF